MAQNPDLSVVVPVFNEAGNIENLYQQIKGALERLPKTHEIILINDGSTDGSDVLLDALCEDPCVKVIHFRRNFGQSAAMMAGFDHAKGEVVISLDADLQNDPADIPLILNKLDEGYTVVSGWRKDRKDKAITRRIPSFFANRLISALSGVPLHDYGCTLKGYRKRFIENLGIYGEMHRFLPVYAKWQGAKIAEIPVSHRHRVAGKSKYGLERTFKVLLDLLLIKFYDGYAQKPMYAFGFVGFASFLVSLVCFFAMVYFKFWGGKSFIQTPLPLLTVQFFLIGIICFLLGITTDLVMRTYFESQNRRPYMVSHTKNMEGP